MMKRKLTIRAVLGAGVTLPTIDRRTSRSWVSVLDGQSRDERIFARRTSFTFDSFQWLTCAL